VLTFEDCLGLCQLSEEETGRSPSTSICRRSSPWSWAAYLMRAPDGELLVSPMLIDDVRAAERQGDLVHAAQLKRCLRHFIEQHRAHMASGQDRHR